MLSGSVGKSVTGNLNKSYLEREKASCRLAIIGKGAVTHLSQLVSFLWCGVTNRSSEIWPIELKC